MLNIYSVGLTYSTVQRCTDANPIAFILKELEHNHLRI